MSKRIKKYADTLKYLSKCDKHTGKSIIKSANPELINCISDICHNILRGNLKLTTSQKQKLMKYKNNIRKIANKKSTQKSKKELIQKGGFLASILGPLVGSLLGPLTKGIFNRK